MHVYGFDRRLLWYRAWRIGIRKDMSDIEPAIPGLKGTKALKLCPQLNIDSGDIWIDYIKKEGQKVIDTKYRAVYST